MAAPACNILFPVDFSYRCMLAARHVKTWVDRFGAVLNTLHVVDAEALGYRSDESLGNELPRLTAKRTADLKYFCDSYFGETVARRTVLSGGTSDMIEYFTKSKKVDLIMLPRNHQSFISRVQRDSLAATILDRCTAPVWTTEHVQAADSPSVNSILCAANFEADVTHESQNNRILQKLKELVSTFHAKVTFLQVIDRQEARTSHFAGLRLSSGAEPWLEQAREELGNSARFVRKSGDVITAIGETAKQVAADLVVVGRTPPGTIGLGVQVHILKIDHVARCPLLSVW